MRRYLPLLLTLLPLAAAGQTLGAGKVQGQPAIDYGYLSGQGTTLWQGGQDQVLALQADDPGTAARRPLGTPLAFGGVGTTLSYGLGSQWQVHAGVSQRSGLLARAPQVVGSEVGATYNLGRYSVGVSVGAEDTPGGHLPRVLPGAMPGVSGLSDFDSSAELNARGRVALGGKSGIDVGASVGRIHLLPGNLLGVDTLDQKALSVGVDHGPLSGVLIGRTMQPTLPGGLYGDRRWSSIDLGVTWRLPWQGELSIGAQNVWSSGSAVNTPAGVEPDQSRTPYVQYHQDL